MTDKELPGWAVGVIPEGPGVGATVGLGGLQYGVWQHWSLVSWTIEQKAGSAGYLGHLSNKNSI